MINCLPQHVYHVFSNNELHRGNTVVYILVGGAVSVIFQRRIYLDNLSM